MDNNLQDFRNNNQEILKQSQDDFEKQLSFISAGTLGVSMFFIEKVVKDLTNANCKWILIVSWSLLGFTLIINLLSHYLAINFNYKNIEEIDADNYNYLNSSRRNKIIKSVNIATLITLISGIICLIVFTSINI